MGSGNMSEYQYYEFLALDRPLTDQQRAELRSISSRAEITATRFVNTYQWGDLKRGQDRVVRERRPGRGSRRMADACPGIDGYCRFGRR